ncbi:MAG: hypothetical protein AAB875_07600, partial [Patescibacteria group bacterium]
TGSKVLANNAPEAKAATTAFLNLFIFYFHPLSFSSPHFASYEATRGLRGTSSPFSNENRGFFPPVS